MLSESSNVAAISRQQWLIILAVQLALLPLIALEEYLVLAVLLSGILAFIFIFHRLANGIILLPLFLFMPFEIPESLGLQFSELGVLLLFLSAIGAIALTGRALKFELPAFPPIALIVLGGMLSMINARYVGASVPVFLKHLEAFIFVFFLTVNFLNQQTDLRKVLIAITIGGFGAALLGIARFGLGLEQRVFGLHGGVYGAFIGTALVCSAALLIHDRKGLLRTFQIIILPFLALALLLSQTRAWTGGTILALLYLVLSGGKKTARFRFILFAGIAAVVVLWIVQSGLLEFGGKDAGDAEQATERAFHFGLTAEQNRGKYISSLMRVFIWWHGFKLYMQNPVFGFGWGNLRFKSVFTGELVSPYEYGMAYLDNHYLNVLYETGILGFAGWIWLMVLLYRNAKQLHRIAPPGEWQAISRGIIGALIIFAFGGIFWALTNVHETTVMWPFLMALLFAAARVLRRQNETHQASQN